MKFTKPKTSLFKMLLEDSDEKSREGNQRSSKRNNQTGNKVALHLLDNAGLHINHVVLLEIEIGGVHDVGIAQVKHVQFTGTIGILTEEFDTIANTIDGHIASHR